MTVANLYLQLAVPCSTLMYTACLPIVVSGKVIKGVWGLVIMPGGYSRSQRKQVMTTYPKKLQVKHNTILFLY